jgi:VIT1/CCC1 family predicted Fe2+/Mn2+ transporter
MSPHLKKLLTFYIGDIVYGANDGIITTFAVIAGAAGAGFSSTVIIVLGIANLIADGFSMGASRYLSLKSEQDVEGARGTMRDPIADGMATFASFVIVGTLPLIPFFIPSAAENAFTVSATATAVTFFLVGAARSLVIKTHPFIAGLEMFVVGGFASVIAFALGFMVQTFIGVV